MRSLQVSTLNDLLGWGKLGRVIENAALNGNDAYSIMDLTADIRNGIWSELRSGSAIDTYRRNLQRAHIERLGELLTEDETNTRFGDSIDASQSDIRAIARAELKRLQASIRAAIPRTSDSMSKIHLEDALERVNNTLDPK